MLTTLAHGLESDDPADQLGRSKWNFRGYAINNQRRSSQSEPGVASGMGPGTAPLQP